MNEWTYLDEIDKLPGTTYICCDTRNFYIRCMSDYRDNKTTVLNNMVRRCVRQECFLFRRDEILGTLKTLEMDPHYNPNPLRYIWFVWTGETVDMGDRIERVYVAYADDCEDFAQLSREELTPENLQNIL